MTRLWCLGILLSLVSCTKTKKQEIKVTPQNALRLSTQNLSYDDDIGLENFYDSLEKQILFLKKLKREKPLSFGPKEISLPDYIVSLSRLLEARPKSQAQLKVYLEQHFDTYQAAGKDNNGEILLTGYFEPTLKGSLTRTQEFTEPLLETPRDLITIDVSTFDDRFKDIRRARGKLSKQKSPSGTKRVIAYDSRQEITELFGKDKRFKPIAWVSPIEAFFLQIQGSGTIKIQNKKIRVGYAEQNGHPYRAIGRDLLDVIPLKHMSLQTIEAHLQSLSKDKAQELMNKNASFVFFQKLKGLPLTSSGIEVIPGRTLATDTQLFPKGALAYLEYETPEFDSLPGPYQPTHPLIKQWSKTSRFVFDQDTGGAIRGAHRVDLFLGKGPQAKKIAGVMKNPAKLYYLVPKL